MGYVVLNMRKLTEALIGDTLHPVGTTVEPFSGFASPKAMVFAGIFPANAAEFDKLRISIERLMLNDRSVVVQRETSVSLGQGFRLGFLGTLHLDVFKQRLLEEYHADIIQSHPNVPYRVVMEDGTIKHVHSPMDMPDHMTNVAEIQEPMIVATLIFPVEYIGPVVKLCGVCLTTLFPFYYV